MKTMSATIRIDAPPMTVWAGLTGLESYPDWNPLFREASGQVAVGNRIRLRSVHPANGRLMTVKPKITVADPGAELRWVASLPGIISGEHYFTLTPAGGGTRLEQGETFRGLLTAFSGKTFARAEVSFQGLNEALKKRVEGLSGSCRQLGGAFRDGQHRRVRVGVGEQRDDRRVGYPQAADPVHPQLAVH